MLTRESASRTKFQDHLGGGITLRQLRDLRGDALVYGVLEVVEGMLRLVERHRMGLEPGKPQLDPLIEK